MTAAESPWQAGITEANGRATQPEGQKENTKSALMQLCQPETCCFELTVSVHISMCSVAILSWLLMFPEQTWPLRRCLFLIVPVNAPSRFAMRHDRLSWKVSDGQSNAACLGGETASLEGVPGRRSSCVLAKKGSGHATWHARWQEPVSWIKERVDRKQDTNCWCRKNRWHQSRREWLTT